MAWKAAIVPIIIKIIKLILESLHLKNKERREDIHSDRRHSDTVHKQRQEKRDELHKDPHGHFDRNWGPGRHDRVPDDEDATAANQADD